MININCKKRIIILLFLLLVGAGIIELMKTNLISNFKIAKKAIEKELTRTIEATYEVISVNNQIYNIILKINSKDKIEKIENFNDVVIDVNNKNNLAIDCKVEKDREYQIKIYTNTGIEEILILDTNTIDTIKITETISYEYPIITENGTETGKEVVIEDEKKGKIYYSLDNEHTWIEYKEPIIAKDIIRIKSVYDDGKVAQIISQKIEWQLANDALKIEAYDKDENTYDYIKSGQNRKINISSKLWDKNISLTIKSENAGVFKNRVEMKNAEGAVLSSYNITNKYEWNQKQFYVPEDTEYLQFTANDYDERFYFYIYEVGVLGAEVVEDTYCYLKIDSNGFFEKDHKLITLKYNEVITEKLYKIGKTEWKEYVEPVKLPIGETIYYKGKDAKGNESIQNQYTSISTETNIFTENIYDGDESTYDYIRNGQNKRIDIDSSLWGKTISLTLKSNNAGSGFKNNVEMKDANGIVLNSHNVAKPYEWNKEQFYVPEGTVYLQFTANKFDGRFNFYIYEIGI